MKAQNHKNFLKFLGPKNLEVFVESQSNFGAFNVSDTQPQRAAGHLKQMNIPHALPIAVKAAKKAGAIAKRDFLNAQVFKIKDHHEFVTKTDIACEKAIIKTIKAQFPNHSFWSEERPEEKTSSEFEWVIDPLDGTHNFMKNNAVFGHSIALTKNGRSIAGVIYFPVLNQMYTAIRQHGVFLNGKRIHASSCKSFADAGMQYFQGMNRKQHKILAAFLKKGVDVRISGSACYNFCLVANGGYSFYLDKNLKPGDFAAGALFVEEAGGVVAQDNGANWNLSSKKFIASNKPIFPKVLAVLKKFGGL